MADGLEGLAESLPGGDTKLGGKSIYLYGFVLAAVVVLYLWWSGRNTVPSSSTDLAATDSGVPNVSGDLGDLPQAAQPNDLVDTTTQTNGYWEAQAIAWLVTQGINPLSAQSAIERYFGGEHLDYNQTVIVNKAIGHFGPPPEGLLSSPDITESNAPGPVSWSNSPGKWKATSGTKAYRKAEDFPAKVYYTVRAGKQLSTVQQTSYNGATLVRASNGTVFNVAELVPVGAPGTAGGAGAPVQWSAKKQKWTTIKGAKTYRKAEDYPDKVYYTVDAGKTIDTVQATTYNGASLVRTTTGTVYSTNDLVPFEKPSKGKKSKGKTNASA